MTEPWFRYGWSGDHVLSACPCGWRGEPRVTIEGARAVWTAHVRDECVLVQHTIPDFPEFDVDEDLGGG